MNICVFCGSASGNDPIYAEAAKAFGIQMAKEGHTLVYGGGNVGLMGIVADAVLEHGGKVIGVIPDFLMRREVAHLGLTTLEVVDTMHLRKQRMAELSNAFVALPGGWGTLDELAEILTWRQLGLVTQPIGILNVKDFFSPLLDQMRKMVEEGFLKLGNLELLVVEKSPAELVGRFSSLV
ncbi:TIGR00730 family Rossman fold protein [Chryseolinea sp. T2]|uniref:LOG family protein n=1 Tax=Chryseolinea sp. T2 TaxID=3129255 RepID=UPI003078791B